MWALYRMRLILVATIRASKFEVTVATRDQCARENMEGTYIRGEWMPLTLL